MDNATSSDYIFEPNEFEWVEKAGIENLKGRLATADTLAKEAATTLTILLAGAGGSWAYCIKLLDEAATRAGVAAFVAALWLTLLAMLLVWRCLMIGKIPALYNQPGQLLLRHQHKMTLAQWRKGELDNIEERIGKAVARNNETARRLNIVRILATLTPVISALAVWVYTSQ